MKGDEKLGMWKILTLAIVIVTIAAPVVAGFTTWLPASIQAGVLALAPPVAAAFVLVAYFNWRRRLKSRIVAGDEPDHDLLKAA
jgi:hypothetical protein